MSDLFPDYSGGTNYRVPNVDVIATASAAITAGDVVPISASAPLAAGIPFTTSAATAAQRKAAYVGVAMASAASGSTLPVRIQGSCYALVKRTSASHRVANGRAARTARLATLGARRAANEASHRTRRAIATILRTTEDGDEIRLLIGGFWSYQLPGLEGLLAWIRSRPSSGA